MLDCYQVLCNIQSILRIYILAKKCAINKHIHLILILSWNDKCMQNPDKLCSSVVSNEMEFFMHTSTTRFIKPAISDILIYSFFIFHHLSYNFNFSKTVAYLYIPADTKQHRHHFKFVSGHLMDASLIFPLFKLCYCSLPTPEGNICLFSHLMLHYEQRLDANCICLLFGAEWVVYSRL